LKLTEPDPLPVAGDNSVIQSAAPSTVHEHPELVVIASVPLPPSLENDCVDGVSA
jgi:hypothetical protein